MRIALITLSILLNIVALAQKPSKKPNKTSFEQKIQIADKLFKEGKTIEAIQSYNIARILAGTDNDKHTAVDKKIEAVFRAIEKQKQEIIHSKNLTEDAKREALSQAQLAEENKKDALEKAELAKANEAKAIKAKEEAEIATNNAKALYWNSEANKYYPIQNLRLLEQAYKKASYPNVLETIQVSIQELFNQSHTHKWQEKRRFLDIVEAKFSPDSKWFFIRDDKGNNRVWEVEKGALYNFLNVENKITYVEFSPNNKWLFTCNDNGNSKLWDLEKCILYDSLQFDKNINEVYFSSDEKWLVTKNGKTSNYTFKVWDVESKIWYNYLKDEKIHEISFSSDNKWLITKDEHYKTKIWDIMSGKHPNFLSISNENSIRASFSSNGKLLILKYDVYAERYSTYFICQVLEVNTGKPLDYLKNENNISDAFFSSDSKWLITVNQKNGKSKKIYKVWEISTGKHPDFLNNQKSFYDADFSPDSEWLITRDEDGVKIWKVSTGKLHDFLNKEREIRSFRFSPDSKAILTGNKYFLNDLFKVRDISSGKILDFLNQERYIQFIKFSPDNQWLLSKTGVINYTYKVWDVSTGTVPDILKQEGEILNANFSQDGKQLITKTRKDHSYTYKIWTTPIDIPPYYLHNNIINSNNFSQDGKWLITKTGVNPYFKYKVRDVSTGKQPKFLGDKNIEFIEAQFSPDGKWLIAIDSSDKYKIWNLETSEEQNFLKGIKYPRDKIIPFLFTKDSKILAIPKNKYSIRGRDSTTFYELDFWDITTGKRSKLSSDIEWTISKDKKHIIYEGTEEIREKHDNLSKSEKDTLVINIAKDSTVRSICTNHQVKTYEVATGKLIQTLWLNKVPTDIDIIDNRYLYVTVGKAIVKTDLQTQQGNLMSYGDGEPLDYQYEEIQAWIKAFGDKYLLPLDEEIKKKYGVD